MSGAVGKSSYTTPQPLEYITKDASSIKELLNPLLFPGLQVSLAEATVEAGAATLPHQHTDCDEIYYCLEGQGTLHINNEPFNFAPGLFYLLPKTTTHYLQAHTRLRLLCICSPPYTHRQTIISE